MIGLLGRKIKKVVIIEPKSADRQVYGLFKIPRGVVLLATILKTLGYEVKVYCEDFAQIDWDDVLSADVVCLSLLTATAKRGYAVAKEVRVREIRAGAPYKPIIMGGVHPTFATEEALVNSADFVVRHEGDKTLPELLEAIEGKRELESVLGIAFFRDNQVIKTAERPFLTNEELDELPFPDKTLVVNWEEITTDLVITSRGCPFNCNFCSVTAMFGRKFRIRSVKRVLDELEVLSVNAGGKRIVVFIGDDNFTAKEKRAVEIGDGIIERGLNLSMIIQARTNTSEATLAALKRAGVGRVCVGLESVSDEALKESNKRQEVKDIINFIERCDRVGVKIHGMFVSGFDNDTPRTIRGIVKFAKKYRRILETIQITILTPFPGTILYDLMVSGGDIVFHDWDLYNTHTVVHLPKKMKPSELQRETYLAMKRFYSVYGIFISLLKLNKTSIVISLFGWTEARRWRWGKGFRSHMRILRRMERRGLFTQNVLPDTTS
ncbi:MAG: radical SAM protein [bacterium]|nr:radical SAM protein [bacterium]